LTALEYFKREIVKAAITKNRGNTEDNRNGITQAAIIEQSKLMARALENGTETALEEARGKLRKFYVGYVQYLTSTGKPEDHAKHNIGYATDAGAETTDERVFLEWKKIVGHDLKHPALAFMGVERLPGTQQEGIEWGFRTLEKGLQMGLTAEEALRRCLPCEDVDSFTAGAWLAEALPKTVKE